MPLHSTTSLLHQRAVLSLPLYYYSPCEPGPAQGFYLLKGSVSLPL